MIQSWWSNSCHVVIFKVVSYKPGGHYHAHLDSTDHAYDRPCCFQTRCGEKELTAQWSECCRLCRYTHVISYMLYIFYKVLVDTVPFELPYLYKLYIEINWKHNYISTSVMSRYDIMCLYLLSFKCFYKKAIVLLRAFRKMNISKQFDWLYIFWLQHKSALFH